MKKVLAADLEQFRLLYSQGRNARQIAANTGFHYCTVLKRCRRLGIKLTNEGKYKRKYSLNNENYFDTIDSDDKAYFLGLIMADGNVYKNRITLCLKSTDCYIIQMFADCVGTNKPVLRRSYNQITPQGARHISEICKLEIVSDIMTDSLEKLGVYPNKTFKLKFPSIDSEYYSHFIRGYFDGDGCFGGTGKDIRFSIVGRLGFLVKIQEILIKNCIINKTLIKKAGNIYCLCYGGNIQLRRIIDFMYKDSCIHLTRKYNKVKHITGIKINMQGENSTSSKLKLEEVLRIKQLCTQDVKTGVIASQFKISKSTIQAIKHKRIWKHVT